MENSKIIINGFAIDKSEIIALLNKGDKIAAVKLVYDNAKVKLKEAKEIVENIEENKFTSYNGFKNGSNQQLFKQQNSTKLPDSVFVENKSNMGWKWYILIAIVIFFIAYFLYNKFKM